MQEVRYNNRPFPHSLPASGPDDLGGTDYGPHVIGAAAAAHVPILWFGPNAFGWSLKDVALTQRHGPEFPPSVDTYYGQNGEIQIMQSLVGYSGEEDQLLQGPSVTVHGATFYFDQGFDGRSAIGLINGREVRIQAPASNRVEWARTLRSLRWICSPARILCSGWR